MSLWYRPYTATSFKKQIMSSISYVEDSDEKARIWWWLVTNFPVFCVATYILICEKWNAISVELKDHGTTCSCFGESIPYEIIEYCFGI